MSIIKIEEPIHEYMDNALTDDQCDKLLENIIAYTNNKPQPMQEDATIMIAAGATIAAIVAAFRAYFKNKYSITIKRLINQTKELNDAYTKLDYMLKNDRKARYKHRNDKVDYNTIEILAMDNRNAMKKYNVQFDWHTYAPGYFSNYFKNLDRTMDSIPEKSKKETLDKIEKDLIKELDDGIEKNFWLSRYCTPILRTEVVKDVKMEKAIMSYKESFESMYTTINNANYYISYQLQNIQLLEQEYNTLMAKYSNNSREFKKVIENVFKYIFSQMAETTNFNSNVIECLIEKVKKYTNEIEKLYEIIKS